MFWNNCNQNPSEPFIPDPDDIWRCYTCDKGFRSEPGLKIHIARMHTDRYYHGCTADKDTRQKLHAEAQATKPHVYCEEQLIENVWYFKYLGSRFRADGDIIADVKARIGAAQSTFGKMRSIWASRTTPLKLKLHIYKTGVCSRLTYGSEAWILNARVTKMINGANSRMVSTITGRTAHEEVDPKTRTFDVVKCIRTRRLRWVGHIARMNGDRLVQKALMHIAYYA